MNRLREAYQSTPPKRREYLDLSSSNFKQSKYSYEQRTNYKKQYESTPVKANQQFFRSSYRRVVQQDNPKPNLSYEREKIFSQQINNKNQKSNSQLDRIQEQIHQISNRLRQLSQISKQSDKKDLRSVQNEKRQLKKRLIDLDYQHKMLCAHQQVQDKNTSTSKVTFAPLKSQSARLRLAEIESNLALTRSRRLRNIQSDVLLYDFYLDQPSYSPYYLHRPLHHSRHSVSYEPYYSSLWWL